MIKMRDERLVVSSNKYTITASKCGTEDLKACVMLTATAIGSQVKDGNLTLDSKGRRTHKGSDGWPK